MSVFISLDGENERVLWVRASAIGVVEETAEGASLVYIIGDNTPWRVAADAPIVVELIEEAGKEESP